MVRRGTLIGASAAAAVLAVGGGLTMRRWARALDPTDGDPLGLPDGEERRVRTADGAELAVTVVPGRADRAGFVLAHCWTGDRRIWGPVARRLAAAGHGVVLYDHRGHGGSSIGSDGLSLAALAADLRAVVEQLDLRGVVVAGHSMGGMAAQVLAIEHPDVLRARVRGVALVATAGDRVGYGPRFTSAASRTVASRHVERAFTSARLGPWLTRGSVGRRASLAHLHAVRATFTATEAATRAGLLTAMCEMDLSAALAGIDVPTLIVSGTRDLLTRPARSRRLAQLIPGARLEVIHGAGHMLPTEVPDRLAELLVRHATAASSPVLGANPRRLAGESRREREQVVSRPGL